MKTATIRHRIDDIISREGFSFRQKYDALVKLYEAEKAKTAHLSDALYRVKKIMVLRSLILKAQTKIFTQKTTTI